jgi:mxaL protein
MKSLHALIAAALLLAVALLLPPLPFPSKQYDYFLMVDISRSMNVQDYQDDSGQPISRLDKVKVDMLKVIQQLPCGSRVGLGVFAERMPTMIHSPIEVCSDYPELKQSINHLDWRMAWVADSKIVQGLYNTLKLIRTVDLSKSTLVFFTDGHEAPPMNMRYAPSFEDVQNEANGEALTPIKGIIIGTGEKGLSRIPKYDEEGNQIGFYTADDVPHRSTFGQPADPSKIEGYVPRNAPWGNKAKGGTEHLSSVKHQYLKELAEKAGLKYHHLQTPSGLLQALTNETFTINHIRMTDLSAIPATLALILLVFIYRPKRRRGA